jgi:hypothetical protein
VEANTNRIITVDDAVATLLGRDPSAEPAPEDAHEVRA